MSTKLILFPLAVLLLITLFSALFYGNGNYFSGVHGDVVLGKGSTQGGGNWHDSGGHDCCDENGTALGEAGWLTRIQSSWNEHDDRWHNGTTMSYGWVTGYDVEQDDTSNIWVQGFDLMNVQWGFLALIAVLMAAALIVGIKVLGSGLTETSVSTLIKGGALIALWAVCSAGSMVAIDAIPVFGMILYFCLTASYTLGIVNVIGHTGGGD